jgi:uncharacterized membrane protein YccC
MNSIATVGKRLRGWPKSHRMELRLCLRITTSAVLTLAISQLLHLRLVLWAVLTAVLLTQMNVGKSLKATTDYLAGTLGGAIFAGVVGTLIPHGSEIALVFVLTITLVPVALVAAENARFSAAPFTAVMVILAPTIIHLGPIASAFERIIEVAVGCIVGLVVSFVVLPARAYDLTIDAAGHLLNLMAQELPKLLGGFMQRPDEPTMMRVEEKIGEAYAKAQAIAVEGLRERTTYLAVMPDLGPLLQILLRLRDDFVMIGRIAVVPLPTAIQVRLGPVLAGLGNTAASYLHASATALVARQPVPPRHAVDAALEAYAAEMAALGHGDLSRDLPAEAMEIIFALAFVLQQLRQHLNDLEHYIAEVSDSRNEASAAGPARTANDT